MKDKKTLDTSTMTVNTRERKSGIHNDTQISISRIIGKERNFSNRNISNNNR